MELLKEKVPNLTIIGTTNIVPKNNGLDRAAMSRFQNLIDVPYPEQDCLYEALKMNLSKSKGSSSIISDSDKELIRRSAKLMDLESLDTLIEKLVNTIEDEETLQLFITRANVLTMNLDHLIKKYDGQPESYYESFKKLTEINQAVKTISQLRREAVTYQRYLAYQSTGSIYNPENINQQLEYLLEELNSAIILLKQEE